MYDELPANCCLLEIKSLPEISFNSNKASFEKTSKDTIFVGTYDGSLYSMRMEIKKEANSETYALNMLKKWTFSHPITSVLILDFYNSQHEAL